MGPISPIDLLAASLSYLSDAQLRVAADIALPANSAVSGQRVAFESFIKQYELDRSEGINHELATRQALHDKGAVTLATDTEKDALVAEAQRYQLKYQAIADVISRNFRMQKLAITGRG